MEIEFEEEDFHCYGAKSLTPLRFFYSSPDRIGGQWKRLCFMIIQINKIATSIPSVSWTKWLKMKSGTAIDGEFNYQFSEI